MDTIWVLILLFGSYDRPIVIDGITSQSRCIEMGESAKASFLSMGGNKMIGWGMVSFSCAQK